MTTTLYPYKMTYPSAAQKARALGAIYATGTQVFEQDGEVFLDRMPPLANNVLREMGCNIYDTRGNHKKAARQAEPVRCTYPGCEFSSDDMDVLASHTTTHEYVNRHRFTIVDIPPELEPKEAESAAGHKVGRFSKQDLATAQRLLEQAKTAEEVGAAIHRTPQAVRKRFGLVIPGTEKGSLGPRPTVQAVTRRARAINNAAPVRTHETVFRLIGKAHQQMAELQETLNILAGVVGPLFDVLSEFANRPAQRPPDGQ